MLCPNLRFGHLSPLAVINIIHRSDTRAISMACNQFVFERPVGGGIVLNIWRTAIPICEATVFAIG